jgi:hypothetical protein
MPGPSITPLAFVWKYVNSEADHGGAHKGRRNLQRKTIAGNVVELSWEQEMDGPWVKSANRRAPRADPGDVRSRSAPK